MDVRFNADAAERLLQQMDVYCSGIQKETKELLATIGLSAILTTVKLMFTTSTEALSDLTVRRADSSYHRNHLTL